MRNELTQLYLTRRVALGRWRFGLELLKEFGGIAEVSTRQSGAGEEICGEQGIVGQVFRNDVVSVGGQATREVGELLQEAVRLDPNPPVLC